MKKKEMEDRIAQVLEMMELILQDMSVPRNIKRAVEESKRRLQEQGDPTVRAGAAIYCLTEVSEDINLPPHARAQLWGALSLLEQIKEK
jgi:uncharacterized protein (UPF0147 family)